MVSEKTNWSGLFMEDQWRFVYLLGGAATILVLISILVDVVIGNISGGNITLLPVTAAERYGQLRQSPLIGLYNLDLLNLINQIILIFGYFAVAGALRKTNLPLALLGLIFYLVATSVFITNSPALPMLDLSNKYALSTDSLKNLYSAAGEAILARGEHGSPGFLPGFFLPNIGSLILSAAMLDGKVFSSKVAWIGIAGSVLLMAYTLLVTFVPVVKEMATAFSMPGGLLMMAWMILYTIRLLKLAKKSD